MFSYFVPIIINFLIWSSFGEQLETADQYEDLNRPAYFQALEKVFGSVRERMCRNKYDWIRNSILRLCDNNGISFEHAIKKMEAEAQVAEPLKRGGYRSSGAADSCCNCVTSYRPRDLGRKYYPRLVSTAYCDSTTCWNRTLNCQPKEYSIKVLRRRTENDEEHEEDKFLPEALRNDWIFEIISVDVACECVM